jgi:peptide/nickel transport system substrate-binding protein
VLRNRNYRGPRKAYVDAIQYTMGVPAASSLLQVQKGEADLGPIPPSSHADLYKTYGNGKRYFVRPSLPLLYVALNNERPLFRDTKLRKAINYAIDRPEIVRQYGYLAGRRTDQFLPDGMPGFTNASIYPIAGARPDLARKLVGDLGGKKAVLLTGNRGSSPLAAQVVQYNLKQIGLDVDIQLVDPALLPQQLGTRGGAWDLAIAGWSADYADPYAFLNVLFDGRRITPVNNTNLNYFNESTVNRRLTKAARLAGPERYREYARLDADLMRTYAPGAPYVVLNQRAFVSARVGCVKFVPLEGLSLASVCLS